MKSSTPPNHRPSPARTHQFASLPLNHYVTLVRFVLGIFLVGFSTAQAAKVLYIQDFARRDTVKLINILKAQGHDLKVWTVAVDGNAQTAQQYADLGYQLLIVDEVISSGAVGGNFQNSPIPVINWEGFLYSDGRSLYNAGAGLTGGTYTDAATALAVNGGLGADYGQVQSETNINIALPGHPLAAGLPAGLTGIFAPDTPPVDADGSGVVTFVGGRTLVPGATVVATVPGFASGYCVMGVDVGVTNYDGVTTNRARWVHLPWNDTDEAERVMVEPSFYLFEAAVAWALNLPQPVKLSNLTPAGGSFLATNTAVSCQVNKTNNAGSAVASGGIVVKINGSNTTAGVTITDAGAVWNVSYTNGFALNRAHTVVVSATSADGGFGARQVSFDTFSTTNFTWEAEDFNFDGGAFFDSVVLCTNVGGGTPGCFYDRVGVTNVDQNEVNFTVTISVPSTNEVYRFGDSQDFFRDEFVDTFLAADPVLRSKYTDVGIPDYEIRNIVANEWLNYTRTYPTGTFNIYARVASAAALTVQLDLVDNGSNSVQNLTKLGRFVKNAGTSGYELVPLTDDSGVTAIVIELTNTVPSTLRATALTGGFTPNYYMLVPTAAPVNQAPIVDITNVTTNQFVIEGTGATIEATVTDDGTITNVAFYAGTTEPLTLLGTDTVAPYSLPYVPAISGKTLTYTTIRVIASDNGGLTAQDNIQVRVIPPGLIMLAPEADAQLNEFNNTVQDTSNGTSPSMNARTAAAVNEVFALRFNLGAYQGQNLESVQLNLVNHRNNSAHILHYYGVNDGTMGLDNNGVSAGYDDNTWEETNTASLKFSTMPGLYFDGTASPGFDTNNITDLGAATMSSGNKSFVVTFGGAAMESFVENHPDALLTMIVATDTTSTGQKRFATLQANSLDGGTPAGALGDYEPFLSFRLGGPTLNYLKVGNSIQFTWSGSFKLQAQTNSLSTGIGGSAWADYPGGGASGVSAPVDPAVGTVFFRLSPP